MADISGNIASYPMKSAMRDRLIICAEQTIGAAGAVGTLRADDPGVTVAKNAGTGTYDIVFPKAIRGQLQVSLVSAAGTVKTFWLAAFSATAGTAQLITGNGGGTATNPASGDILQLEFILDTRSDS